MLSEFKRSRWKGRVEGVSFVSSVVDFSLLSSLTGLVLSSSSSLSLPRLLTVQLNSLTTSLRL